MPETKLAAAEIVARTLHRHLGENWGEDQEDAAHAVVDAFRDAGRLLPEGGETEAHWRSRYLATGNAYEMRGLRRSTRQEVESDVMHDRALGYDVVMESRTVRYWPDATTFTGPWVAVDQEATDAE